MVQYIRECTSPRERIYAAWFDPEVYFFARRGFAAGLVVTFGGHWSEPRFQTRSVRAMRAQSVPIVIVPTGDATLRNQYPLIARHLDETYREAGTTDFGAPESKATYTVLIRKDRQPSRLHPPTLMPCFD